MDIKDFTFYYYKKNIVNIYVVNFLCIGLIIFLEYSCKNSFGCIYMYFKVFDVRF